MGKDVGIMEDIEKQKVIDYLSITPCPKCGGKITLSAPFVDWTKKQIFDYCRLEKIPLELTYSCELGKNQPCGECSSCKELTALYETKNK